MRHGRPFSGQPRDPAVALAGPGGPLGPEPGPEPRLACQPAVDGPRELGQQPAVDRPGRGEPAPQEPGADVGLGGNSSGQAFRARPRLLAPLRILATEAGGQGGGSVIQPPACRGPAASSPPRPPRARPGHRRGSHPGGRPARHRRRTRRPGSSGGGDSAWPRSARNRTNSSPGSGSIPPRTTATPSTQWRVFGDEHEHGTGPGLGPGSTGPVPGSSPPRPARRPRAPSRVCRPIRADVRRCDQPRVTLGPGPAPSSPLAHASAIGSCRKSSNVRIVRPVRERSSDRSKDREDSGFPFGGLAEGRSIQGDPDRPRLGDAPERVRGALDRDQPVGPGPGVGSRPRPPPSTRSGAT